MCSAYMLQTHAAKFSLLPEQSLYAQVYAFGPISIVMDTIQGIVRAHLRDKWVPVSLDQLVQEASKVGR